MSYYVVPFHVHERLPELVPPVPAAEIAPPLPAGRSWASLAHLYGEVAETVRYDERPVVLSGDCTTSMGVLAGLQRRGMDPAIVWFDAHGDFNTPQTTPSGYLGGMPLALALGLGEPTAPRMLGLRRIPAEQTLLVDGRDLDPGEADLIAGSGLRHVPIGEVSTWLVPDGPVYLHVDVDVLDPDEVPGLRYPAPGGPALGTVIDAVRTVASTGRIAAVGLGITVYPEHLDGDRLHDVLKAVLAVIDS